MVEASSFSLSLLLGILTGGTNAVRSSTGPAPGPPPSSPQVQAEFAHLNLLVFEYNLSKFDDPPKLSS
jgi:hypothetical protein